MLQFGYVFAYILRTHGLLVELVEIGIEWYEHLLVGKRFAAIKFALIGERITAAAAHILKCFALKKMQLQVGFTLIEREFAGIGKNNTCIAVTLTHIVDHHIVECAALFVLIAHKHIVARNLVVECAFGDIEVGRFLAHREHQCPHLHLSSWQHLILKEKCAHRHHGNKCYQGLHHIKQRHSRSFHSRQFAVLTKITKGHKRGKQYGKRQRHRHHSDGGIEEHLAYHIHPEALAHKVVEATPQKVHQQDKKTYKECHKKHRQISLQDECM